MKNSSASWRTSTKTAAWYTRWIRLIHRSLALITIYWALSSVLGGFWIGSLRQPRTSYVAACSSDSQMMSSSNVDWTPKSTKPVQILYLIQDGSLDSAVLQRTTKKINQTTSTPYWGLQSKSFSMSQATGKMWITWEEEVREPAASRDRSPWAMSSKRNRSNEWWKLSKWPYPRAPTTPSWTVVWAWLAEATPSAPPILTSKTTM